MDILDNLSDIEDDSDNEGGPNNIRRAKRYIRDAENPFEIDEWDFQRRYRFTKDSVLFGILPEIQAGLIKHNNRGLPIAPQLQLLICLRYFATSSFQLVIADTMKVSQSTVSRIVFRVATLLASLINLYIKIPTTGDARNENHRLFNVLGRGHGAIGLPRVDGAIDCTHIKLVGTRFNQVEEMFRNRKGYFSLNVQAVVGPRMEFLDIVPEWPGRAHDSRIFQNSLIHMRYVQGRLDGILVGDKGYPCLPFLMTPFRNPHNEEEMKYNEIQIRTRIIVERTFGVWKRRFPCLARGMATKLVCSTTTVVACAVLHNMALRFNDILPEDDELHEYEEVPVPNAENINMDGEVARQLLVHRLFN
ncbi:putative nuclease HARBI1 [Leptopilina heterotoma]|uniref:putative nuclease HARBI1 n=1 Tax=Leptopilina heterotoma TaxID=63436 RepID=UPI001CA870B5|nr:putative nuclease HARBI1 [Leptopilina heterotoma]